jgi:hypothetical protein
MATVRKAKKTSAVPTPTTGLARAAGLWFCDGWGITKGDHLVLCGPGGARVPALVTSAGKRLQVMLTVEGGAEIPASLPEGAPIRLPDAVYCGWLARGLVHEGFTPTHGGPVTAA